MTPTFVPLDNKHCLQCAYLVTHETRFRDKCKSLGTEACPAGQFKIGIGVNVDKASSAIAQALYEKDVEKLQRLINKLAGYPQSETKTTLDLVFNKTALLYGIEISDGDDTDSDTDEEGDDNEDLDLSAEGGPDQDEESDEDSVEGQGDQESDFDEVGGDGDDEDADLVGQPSDSVAATQAQAQVQAQSAPVQQAVEQSAVSQAPVDVTATQVAADQAESADDEWTDGGQP